MSPIELLYKAIETNDISLVEQAYTMLTGQVFKRDLVIDSPKKRGRPKKEVQSKVIQRKSSEKFTSPDISGPVRVCGNSFTDHGDLCREKLSKEEEVQLSRINSNLRNKEPQQENLVKRTCKTCNKEFKVRPVIAGRSKNWYCDPCLSSKR